MLLHYLLGQILFPFKCTNAYGCCTQTIFRNAPNLVFIVAADRRWLNSSYQKVYSPFSDTFKDVGRPLGYLFLDKTFQISAMPKLSGHYREAYFDYLVTLDRDEFQDRKLEAEDQAKNKIKTMSSSQFEKSFIESPESPEGTEKNNQPLDNLALREVFVEQIFTRPEFKRKTENFLKKFSEFMEPNPRLMKRLVTAFGLWRARDILTFRQIE